MIGKKLGRYLIIEKIGEGGMGVLYKAHDEHLKRDVAIKILASGKVPDEKSKKRFRKEALALSRLNHPNIATIYDLDTDADKDFIVMEYVSGITLCEKLEQGAIKEDEIISIGKQLTEALIIAHKNGVIHRDLKPGNIMILPSGRIKVLDFGIAKLLNPTSQKTVEDSISIAQTVVGTPSYMSPEQLIGKRVSRESDLFSLGIVLYEMITGDNPFRDIYSQATAYKTVHEDPQPPSSIRKDLSINLDKIVLKLLKKSPDERFGSAEEVGKALSRFEGSKMSSPLEGRKKLITIGALVVATVLLLFGYQTFFSEIYSSEAYSRVIRRVTYTGKADIPIMSPDGKNIAYYQDGSVHLVAASGGTPRIIDSKGKDASAWCWCHDGSGILTHGWDPDLKKLVVTKLGLYGEEPQVLVEAGIQPDMSSDGKELIYTKLVQGEYSLVIRNMESGVDKVIREPEEPGTTVFKALFSPDGKKISYMKWDGYSHKLWVMSRNGSGAHEVTADPIQLGGKYCWTKDSKAFLIAGQLHGIWSIWKINASGTGHVRMTAGSERERHVTRSPDGSSFVFGRQQDLSRIVLINIDEPEIEYPFDIDIPSKHPAFSNDGNSLYFQVLVNEQWQIWSARLDDTGHPKPVITNAQISCGWPVRGKKDNIFYIQSDVARPRLWGEIMWSLELWSSRPDGGIQKPVEAPGKRVKRIAPSSFRHERILFTEQTKNRQEILFTVTQQGERKLIFQDTESAWFSGFDWGVGDSDILVSHYDTSMSFNSAQAVSIVDMNNMKWEKLFSVDTLSIDGQRSPRRNITWIALSPDRKNLAFILSNKGIVSIYRFDVEENRIIHLVDFPKGTYPANLAWDPSSLNLAVEVDKYKSDIYISEPSEDYLTSSR